MLDRCRNSSKSFWMSVLQIILQWSWRVFIYKAHPVRDSTESMSDVSPVVRIVKYLIFNFLLFIIHFHSKDILDKRWKITDKKVDNRSIYHSNLTTKNLISLALWKVSQHCTAECNNWHILMHTDRIHQLKMRLNFFTTTFSSCLSTYWVFSQLSLPRGIIFMPK